ncbi:MerR family DNA-binding transcriptional regulator [Nocardia gipuzkoensis]
MTGLRRGQLAAAAGVDTQTLRYYERRGLLAEPHPPPHRRAGGRRSGSVRPFASAAVWPRF